MRENNGVCCYLLGVVMMSVATPTRQNDNEFRKLLLVTQLHMNYLYKFIQHQHKRKINC